MYNFTNPDNIESSSCLAKGNCSMTPDTAALKEVFLNLFAYISYFLLKEDIVDNKYFDHIIKVIANSDIRNEYTDEQILNVLKKTYSYSMEIGDKYKNNPDCDCKIKPCIKSNSKLSYSEIITKGEQLSKAKQRYGNRKNNYLKEILFFVIKSLSISYLSAVDYKIDAVGVNTAILQAILTCEDKNVTTKDIIEKSQLLAQINIKLHDKIYNAAVENFGEPMRVTVNTSTGKNKAILITGSSLLELKKLLDNTEGKEIDVYTNGNLLVAHSFPYFKRYSSLKGHFCNSTENTILDYATFPGSVILTKWEYKNTGNLYQGKFFSTNEFLPNGISHTDENFTDAIENTLNSVGFVNVNKRESIVTGINFSELDEKIDEINHKMELGSVKRLIFIGLSTLSNSQKDYFKQLLKNIDEKTYVISFSHIADIKNLIYLNVSNNYTMLLNAVNHIFKKISPSADTSLYYVLRCDPNSISTIIYFKMLGVKNLYFWGCSPTTINPSVVKVFQKTFKLKEMTNPEYDFGTMQS